MQIKLLNEIITEIAGKQASEIIEILYSKKDVNEFFVAKKLKLTINQTRNIFYKLSNFGLVSFTRKKDRRKGWYTYFWTLDTAKALELLDRRIEKNVEQLKQQLTSREKKRFYSCKTCKIEVTEETALAHNFTCQECGQVYELSESISFINELKNKIAKLEKQRASILHELNSIRAEEAAKKKKLAGRAERKAKKKKAGKKKKQEKKKEITRKKTRSSQKIKKKKKRK